ncbi:MAG: hypothetical protein M1826_004520 [Phylliscum demangeonii]|nr:MAG: hypothetical protein M1826_004520 [Phylliscum demangeonii]
MTLQLLHHGFLPADIAVICFYQAQCEVYRVARRAASRARQGWDFAGVQIKTVDGFQGGEASVVILDYTITNILASTKDVVPGYRCILADCNHEMESVGPSIDQMDGIVHGQVQSFYSNSKQRRWFAVNVDRAQVFPLAADSPFARAQARDREVLSFHVYLAGVDKAALFRQTEAPVRSSPDADGWIRGLHTLFEAARHALTEIHGWADPNQPGTRVSRRQRCLLNSLRADETAMQPFRVVAQQDTIRRYAEEWARALCFVVRHVDGVWEADLAAASPPASL